MLSHAYKSGLDVLGATMASGLSLGVPKLKLDPNLLTSKPSPAGARLTPAQLADLDRKLTPEEQARVTAWQSGQADTMLEEERAKGGPRSATVSVTPEGAVIEREAEVSWYAQDVPVIGRPLWQVALGAVGIVAVTVGVYKIATGGQGARSTRSTRSYMIGGAR